MNERTEPGSSRESIWSYPRPPRTEETTRRIRVVFNGVVLADTRRAVRVLETSHPPVYYIAPEDIQMAYLQPTTRHTFCEWKGQASYYSVVVAERQAPNAAWFYPNPTPGYTRIKNYVAFYAQLMDECYVDDERVRPESGLFYGGWITSDIET